MASVVWRRVVVCLLAVVCGATAVAAAGAEALAAAQSADQGREPAAPVAQPQPESLTVPILSAKLFRHADRVIARFDKDGSGRWEQPEWAEAQAALSLELERLDADGDGVISALEVAEYIALFGRHRVLEPIVRTRQNAPQPPPLLKPSTPSASVAGDALPADAGKAQSGDSRPAGRESGHSPAQHSAKKFHVSPSRLPPGLPEWFLARDADGDGQLDFAEFAPQGGQWAMEQFRRYDANEDGLITPQEVLGAKHTSGGGKGSPK